MQKFKLKKDGEVVGYLQIIGRPKGILFSPSLDGVWIPYLLNHPAMNFDTAHPFVCLDKHGEEVYAGDKVGISDNGQLLELGLVEFVRFQWCIKRTHPHTGKHYYDRLETFFSDIELIKNKD